MKFDVTVPVPRLCRRIERNVPAIRYGSGEIHVHSFSVGCTRAGERVKPHQHGYYEGIWVLQGRGRNAHDGGYALRPGVCELHMPRQRHGWTAVSDVWRLGIWFDVVPHLDLRCGANLSHRQLVKEPLGALLQEAQSSSTGRRERVAARLLLILAPVLELLKWPDSETNAAEALEGENRVAHLVDRFFEDNLAEPLSLCDVAQQMNMSVPTLTRHVREETGESVMNRLQNLRMKRAVALMENAEETVKEIAVQVGIPEPSYFCRCFRRHFGRSPQAWREERAWDTGPS